MFLLKHSTVYFESLFNSMESPKGNKVRFRNIKNEPRGYSWLEVDCEWVIEMRNWFALNSLRVFLENKFCSCYFRVFPFAIWTA